MSLTVGVAGKRYEVGLDHVRVILEIGAGTGASTAAGRDNEISPLPWCPSSVEGLARIEGRPIVQFGPWRESTSKSVQRGVTARGWRLILKGEGFGAEIAVRVDEVFGLACRDEAVTAEPLPLSLFWRACHQGHKGSQGEGRAVGRVSTTDIPAVCPVRWLEILWLRFRGERLALLLDGVRGVVTLDGLETVTTLGGESQRLARVGGRLLPAVILSERFGAGPVIGPWAVIGGIAAANTDDGEIALILPEKAGFDRIALETVERIQALPGAVAWWQSGAAEPPVGVYTFATLAGGSGASPKLEAPFGRTLRGGGAEGQPVSETIRPIQAMRLTCGEINLSLPLAVVRGALDWHALPALVPVSGRPRRDAIPVVDGRRLLMPASPDTLAPGSGLWLGLGPPGQVRAVLVVDGVAPEEDSHPDSPWLEPPCLPTGAAALIEAVRWDAVLMTWVLRLRPDLAFLAWPMVAKRAVAAALIGWLPNDLPSLTVVSKPMLSSPSEMI